MDAEKIDKYFDLIEIDSQDTLQNEIDIVNNNQFLMSIIDSLPQQILIMNKKRQIVASNKAALASLTKECIEEILGLRIGHAFCCIRRDEYPEGCGTTKFCKECGFAKAINHTNNSGDSSVEEWRLTFEQNGRPTALNYEIHSDIINIDGLELLLLSIQDISAKKRIEILEKMFFHDVLNTSGALHGLASIFPEVTNDDDRNEIATTILESTNQLIEEIKSQRDLVWAEKGNLEVKNSTVSVNNILKSVYELYSKGDLARGKNFVVSYIDTDININTDATLLTRSLGNLVKNALEASAKGNEVKIYTENENSLIKFHVYNEKVIDETVELQIFQKTFSTKNGLGRGIGTYSVKLLVEQFLKGQVYLKSSPTNKTIFTIELPY